jgi:hypothetical protein
MAQLPSQSQFGDYGEWPGRDVLDSGGERLGGVREIYLDRETGRPEWVLVDVEADHEARFVPLADASVGAGTIRVAHSADTVRHAPGIGAEPRIDQSEERRLYDHYGLGYSEDASASGLPAATVSPPASEDPASAFGAEEPKPAPWQPPEERVEPTNVSPPAAEPPAPEELATAPTPAGEILTEQADLKAQHGPDAVRAFPELKEVPPPAPEAPAGPLASLKQRRPGIAAGVGIAALLFIVVRKLR